MIAFIRGRIDFIEEDTVIIDLGGIALAVLVPMAMINPRPVIGEEILLHTHLHVREDGWLLFGFTDKEQLSIFRMVQAVSGIGAKTALSIVDHFSANAFAAAVATKDSKVFSAVSGIGKKTAERIILELKDKFPHIEEMDSQSGLPLGGAVINDDLLLALKQLGYSATESRAFGLKAQSVLGFEALPEDLLREALKIAMKS